MITSLFRKSTPLNYSLVIIAVVVFFFLYQISQGTDNVSALSLVQKGVVLTVLFASLFTTNFIIKRNGLSKDSTFTVLFYFLFLLFFPSVWNNMNLLLANFFIILALRRLISLQSLKEPKEKIFDASLWIFVATLFHFWCILYIILVFIAILFHVARDYRNWLLPLIAFFAIALFFILASLVLQTSWISYLLQTATLNYNFDYFQNNYQNIALSIFMTVALFFLVSLALSVSSRPLVLHASYKKIVSAFFIGIIIFIVSPNKSNDLLLFTFAPLAIMGTIHIEIVPVKWQKEVVLFGILILGLFSFFSQL